MGEIETSLTEISTKLDKILKLLSISTVKGIETEQGKIELLDQLGFRPIEIANFLSKSPDNISVQLSIIRKKKGKTGKGKEPNQDTGDKEAKVANVTSETMGNHNV